MEYAYATLLLNEAGREINERNLTAVLEAADADVSESRAKAVVAALEGVDLDRTVETPDASEVADDATPATDSGAVTDSTAEDPELGDADAGAARSDDDEESLAVGTGEEVPGAGTADRADGPASGTDGDAASGSGNAASGGDGDGASGTDGDGSSTLAGAFGPLEDREGS